MVSNGDESDMPKIEYNKLIHSNCRSIINLSVSITQDYSSPFVNSQANLIDADYNEEKLIVKLSHEEIRKKILSEIEI